MTAKEYNKARKTNKLDDLKIPPHSIEAEQSVLGGLLLDNSAWDSVSELLTERDFYRPEHKTIFEIAASLLTQGKAVDVLVLSQFLGTGCRIAEYCRDMERTMLSFKWKHFKQSIILMAVRWYLAYAISYRDIEELMAERGVIIDHSTVNCWVIEYAPQLENEFRKKHKTQVGCSWRADETYVKIKGERHYLYRAVDKEGNTVDFYLSKHRDKSAAEAFFRKAIGDNMLPEKVVIDKSGSNKAALDSLNLQLALLFLITRIMMPILVRQIKYLNNLIEQDHRAIKKIINPMKGFKSFEAAKATVAGIELHHMLRKGQYLDAANMAVYEQFYALAV